MAKKSDKTAAARAAALAAAAAAATSQATSQAKAQASELGDRLAPVVDDARERLVDLTGTVATRIDDLTGTVAARLDDALPDRVTPAVVKHRLPTAPRPSRLRQALLVLALGTVAAVVTRRLTGGAPESTWHSEDRSGQVGKSGSDHGSIPGTDQASGTVPGSGGSDADEIGSGTTAWSETRDVASVDVAGGTPEEVAADATDTPHEVTTPDRPAQKVIID